METYIDSRFTGCQHGPLVSLLTDTEAMMCSPSSNDEIGIFANPFPVDKGRCVIPAKSEVQIRYGAIGARKGHVVIVTHGRSFHISLKAIG